LTVSESISSPHRATPSMAPFYGPLLTFLRRRCVYSKNKPMEVVDFLIFDPGRRAEHHYFTDEALKNRRRICLPARMTPDVQLTVPSANALTQGKTDVRKDSLIECDSEIP